MAPNAPSDPPGKLLVRVLGALALVTLIVWLVVGYVGCKHAGLV